MKAFLVVFLLINGSWVYGPSLDGWGWVEYKSLAECQVALDAAEGIHGAAPDLNHVPQIWLCLSPEELL